MTGFVDRAIEIVRDHEVMEAPTRAALIALLEELRAEEDNQMARATITLDNPNVQSFTVSLSMTVSEWRRLYKMLDDNMPNDYEPNQLKRAVGDVLHQAAQAFHSDFALDPVSDSDQGC